MEAKDPGNSLPTIQSKTTSERSIFDFSSVEDLRPTNDHQDSDLAFFDKTQSAIPFDKSYIAHAPSRHLLKLNSRYTFFGGHGGSSKDIRGSVEDLTGYTSKMKRSSNLGKFSKSSPDLKYVSYQTSDDYDVTKQQSEEDFVMCLNMKTTENKKECSEKESTKRGENNQHDNGNVREIRSSTEAKLENEPKVRLETKWATKTELEARSYLIENSTRLETRASNATSAGVAQNEWNNDQDTTTHALNPGTKEFEHQNIVSGTSETSGHKYADPERCEVFHKSWKTILYSGKAELRKSLESLNSFRRGMNTQQNVDTLGNDSAVLHESDVTDRALDHAFESGKNAQKYEIGAKRNDEMAGLDALLWSEKRQRQNEDDVFSKFNEDSTSNGELTATVKPRKGSETTTKQDSKWMTCHKQEYTKNHGNTNCVRTTLTQESTKLTANESEGKRAFLSSVDSRNDNVQSFTSRKGNAAVDELFSQDTTRVRTRYRNLPTLKTTQGERNSNNNVSINNNKNLSVLQMEETVGIQQPTDDFHTPRPLPAVRSTSDVTFDSQEIPGTITVPSCNISQITLKVLNDSTFCDKNQISQHKDRKIDTFSNFETGKDQDDLVTKLEEPMSSEVDMFLPYTKGSLCDNGVGVQEAKSQQQKPCYKDSYNGTFAVKVSGIRQSSVSVTQADRSSWKYPCQWLETKTGGEETDRVESKNNRKDILVDFGEETNEARGLSNVKEPEDEVQVKKGQEQEEKKGREKEVETVEEHLVNENTTPERRDWSGDQQQPPEKEGEVLNWSDFEIKERNEKTQTKMHTKSQTIGEQNQLVPLTDDSVHISSTSIVLTQEQNNNNTDDEKTKSVESPEETTDNSLIKNMMGMFCSLGLKDSPEGGFYKNEGHYKGQTAAKDISGLEYEHELDVKETAYQSSGVDADKPKVRKEIKKRLFNITEEQAFLKQNETGTLTYKEKQDITSIVAAPVLGDYCNIVEEQQTQPETLYENPPKEATVKDNISYFHTGSETARKGMSTSDKDPFLHPEPETTLRILYNESGRQNKVDDGRNTEVNTDEGSILHTTNVQDLLRDIKGDSEENLTKTSELDEFEKQGEMIVEHENKAMVLRTNAAFLNTQHEELESVCEESRTGTKNRSKQDTIITTNLNINRNKWSHSFILPPRKLNVPNSKKVSATFNVLVLNKDLTLVSPERRPTIVTLNLFPRETVEKSSRRHSNEISQVRIVMNVETETTISNPIQTENNVVEYKMEDESVAPTLTEKVKKESLPDIQEKEGNEHVSDHFPKLESDYMSQETKAEVEGINERLSEHLMCFEMDELVDEKIAKQECKRHESLPELDEILLPDTEIREIIGKEEIDIEYELLSQLDGLFNLEEVQENEAEFIDDKSLASLPRNNQVLSLQFTTQNAEMIKKTQNMEEQYSIQSKDKVCVICTKTVHDRCLQSDYLSQIDDMLEQEQIQEFIPDKVDVQHDKQYHFLESDKYFDFIKTVQQSVTDEIDAKRTEQSFELPKQSADLGILPPSVEKPNSETLESNFFQINEDKETVQADCNNNGSNSRELNLTESAFETTVNEQEALPATESTSIPSKDNTFHNTNGDHPVFVISHFNYPSVDCIRQHTVSPIADESSSIVSNYDASAESSSDTSQNYTQQESEEELIDEEEYVPWDITVSYSNPETMKSEFKVLRATYSNIQPEVHKIKSGSIDGKVNIDEKRTLSHIKKRPKISDQIYTTMEASTNPKIAQCTENNLSSDIDATLNDETLMDNGNQYRTTMDIHQNQKQVSTSYVVLQRFGKQESPRTYFELNYDMDVWKVGAKIASRIEDDAKKAFVVSYGTIEQVKLPQRAEVHLEKIDEEETYDEDIYNPFSSKQLTPTKVPLPSPSTPKPVELNNNEFPSTKELVAFQLPSTSQEVVLAQSPPISPSSMETSQTFKNYEQTRAASLKSSPSSSPPPSFLQSMMTATDGTMLDVQQNENDPYGIQKQTSLPTEVLIPENIPHLPISPQTSNTNTTEVQPENDHQLPQISELQNERNLEDICYPPVKPFPILSPTTTPTKTVQGEEINPYLPLKEPTLESISYPPPPPPTPQTQAPPTTFTKETQQEKIARHLLEKDSPPQKSLNLDSKMLNQHSVTTHSPIPTPVHITPVWSFARSVFHTDGENKTFFKVIDDRNKCFQSSTFMYRGDRVRVSRGVNVFRSHFENREQDICSEQTIHCRADDDYEGYSEIWDDGNMIADDNEVMLNVDGPVNRSKAFYELATEQNLFYEQDGRNCSWYLKVYGSFGVCKLSPSNLDATATEDDNTLLGSRGFASGHHTWVIQGLGIFCAVGVCYPGEDVRRWYKGGKWVWTTDGLRYSEPHGIRKSDFGQWRNEDVLEISLSCEEHKLTIVNTRTNVQATLDGFEGEVFPYFNIYKGSSIRLLETSLME